MDWLDVTIPALFGLGTGIELYGLVRNYKAFKHIHASYNEWFGSRRWLRRPQVHEAHAEFAGVSASAADATVIRGYDLATLDPATFQARVAEMIEFHNREIERLTDSTQRQKQESADELRRLTGLLESQRQVDHQKDDDKARAEVDAIRWSWLFITVGFTLQAVSQVLQMMFDR